VDNLRDDFMIAPDGSDTTLQTPNGDLLTWPKRQPVAISAPEIAITGNALADVEKALAQIADEPLEPTGPLESADRQEF
jgi:hypothetical protein